MLRWGRDGIGADMREPLKTRLIGLWAVFLLISGGTSAVYLIRWFGTEHLMQAGLVLVAYFGAMFGMLGMSRFEYGEWSKGVPWWERMKDGYRPPIQLAPDQPTDPE